MAASRAALLAALLLCAAAAARGAAAAASAAAEQRAAASARRRTRRRQADEIELRHHVLVMTNKETQGWALGFMQKILQGYDIPFTVMVFGPDSPSPPPADLEPVLWRQKDVAGNFSAFVMYPNLEALATLSTPQAQQIRAYQAATGARMLKFGVWGADLAHTPVAFKDCTTGHQAMTLLPNAPIGVSGARPNSTWPTEGMYRCAGLDGQTTDTTCVYPPGGLPPTCYQLASKPEVFLRLAPNSTLGPSYTQPMVAGAILRYQDGSQYMGITFDCSEAYFACFPLGHMGVAWVLQNIIPGQRRSLLSLQIDDIFLPTQLDQKTERFRISAPEIQAHADWQKAVNARLPKGSDVKLDLVYNGNGILERIFSPAGVKMWQACQDRAEYTALGCSCFNRAYADCPASAPAYCRNCTKTWQKPPGAFGNTPPAGPPDQWDAAAFLAGDDLYRLFKTNADMKDAFLWTGHMFAHQVLDNVTYEGVARLVKYNRLIAGKDFLDIDTHPGYSTKVIVPPEVSGVCNGDGLRALWDNGIRAVVGDNTWKHMLNPTTPYRIRRTTKENNGFDGMAILPRWSTVIYYDTSTADELTGAYNRMYPPVAGAAPTRFADILANDARRVVLQGLLPLRMDGYMFHQANLRISPINGKNAAPPANAAPPKNGAAAAPKNAALPGRSLVMAWTEGVLALLGQYVTWPVRSLSLDDIENIYSLLEARDRCQITYTITVARGANWPAAGGAGGAPGGGGAAANASAAAGGAAAGAGFLPLAGAPPPAPGAVRAVTLSSAAPPAADDSAEPCMAPVMLPRGVSLKGMARKAVNTRPPVGGEPPVFLVKFPAGGAVSARLISGAPYSWGW